MDLSNELIELMPEPSIEIQTDVGQPDNSETITEHTSQSTLTDKDGKQFDETIHAVDEKTGEPKLTKTGRFARKRGRKSTLYENKKDEPKESAAAGEAPTPDVDYLAMGKMLGGMFFGAAMTLGGEEFTPSAMEEQLITKSFGDYCASKQMSDLPPSVALLGAITIYVLPRLRMPTTKKRMSGIKNKLGIWWLERKQRKQDKKLDAALKAEQAQAGE